MKSFLGKFSKSFWYLKFRDFVALILSQKSNNATKKKTWQKEIFLQTKRFDGRKFI